MPIPNPTIPAGSQPDGVYRAAAEARVRLIGRTDRLPAFPEAAAAAAVAAEWCARAEKLAADPVLFAAALVEILSHDDATQAYLRQRGLPALSRMKGGTR
jgi:hypothetical protein